MATAVSSWCWKAAGDLPGQEEAVFCLLPTGKVPNPAMKLLPSVLDILLAQTCDTLSEFKIQQSRASLLLASHALIPPPCCHPCPHSTYSATTQRLHYDPMVELTLGSGTSFSFQCWVQVPDLYEPRMNIPYSLGAMKMLYGIFTAPSTGAEFLYDWAPRRQHHCVWLFTE